jgi:hypothetical protein
MTASMALRRNPTVGQKPQTCFIAAPVGVDVEPLENELLDRGIAMPDVASFSTGSFDWRTLSRGIKDVDIVVAVISSDPPDPNVMIEVGMALGADRPVLVLVGPQVGLPWALRGVQYVRATPADVNAVRFHLDVFLDRLGEPDEEQEPRPVRHPSQPSQDGTGKGRRSPRRLGAQWRPTDETRNR